MLPTRKQDASTSRYEALRVAGELPIAATRVQALAEAWHTDQVAVEDDGDDEGTRSSTPL